MKDIITPLNAPDHPTVGHFFRSHSIPRRVQTVYYCESYDPACGFWMIDTEDVTDRRNVSERAIGRTYHELYLRPPLRVGQIYNFGGTRVWIEDIKYFWRYDGPSVVGSYKEHRASRGQWPLIEFVCGAELIIDPRHDISPHRVRPIVDAIRILSARHREAAYYLGLQLHAQYTTEEIMQQTGPVFDNADVWERVGCQCPQVVNYANECSNLNMPLRAGGCLCSPDERMLRAYANAVPGLPLMTLPQREYIIGQAEHDAEGALQRSDLEYLTDQALAHESLQAMADYVRSQIG